MTKDADSINDNSSLKYSKSSVTYYYKENWSFRFLLGDHKPNYIRFLGILSLWFVSVFVLCWWRGALLITGDHIGLLEDLVMVSLVFVLPAIVALSLNLLRRLESFFAVLPDIINPSTNGPQSTDVSMRIRGIREFVSLRTRSARLFYKALFAVIIVLIYVFQIHIPVFLPQKTLSWAIWPSRFPVLYGFAICWAVFYWGMIICSAAWFAISVSFTVFPLLHLYSKEHRIQVLPVSPDGRGGLAPIGSLSFSVTLLISVGLIVVIFWVILFGVDLPLIAGFGIYLAILVAAFFIPLLSVHSAMKEAKEAELHKWASFFRRSYTTLPGMISVESEVGSDVEKLKLNRQLNYLNQIERLYARAEAMPVWPFDLITLKKFVSLIIVPLLLFAVQVATQNALSNAIQRILK